ncbi:hypothetical protein BC831DRAFT_507020 [Entophlyctis helioformis]|nr:hypothetical protein BC831DRAFT_507020 [Entophlyctis helioformis]
MLDGDAQRIATLDTHIASLKDQLAAAKDEIASRDAQLQTLAAESTDQLSSIRESSQEQVASLTAQVESLTAQVASLTAQVAGLTAANADLDKQVAESADKTASLQQQLGAQQTMLDDDAQRIATLDTHTASLEDQLAAAKNEIASRDAQLQTLAAESTDQLSSIRESSQEQVASLTATIEGLTAQVAGLTAQVASLTAANADLNSKLSAALQDHNAEITQLNAALSHEKTQTESLASIVDTLRHEIASIPPQLPQGASSSVADPRGADTVIESWEAIVDQGAGRDSTYQQRSIAVGRTSFSADHRQDKDEEIASAMKRAESERARAAEERNRLLGQVADLQSQLNGQLELNAVLEQTVFQQQEQIAAFSSIETDARAQTAESGADVEALPNELAVLYSQNRSLVESNAGLMMQHNTARDRVAALEIQVGDIQASRDQVLGDLMQTQARNNELKTLNESSVREAAETKEQVAKLALTSASAETRIADLEAQQTEYVRMIGEYTALIDQLEVQLQAKANETLAAADVHADVQAQTRAHEQALAESHGIILNLQSQLNAANTRIADLAQAETAAAELQAANDELRRQIAELTAETESLQTSFINQRVEVDQLSADLAAANETLYRQEHEAESLSKEQYDQIVALSMEIRQLTTMIESERAVAAAQKTELETLKTHVAELEHIRAHAIHSVGQIHEEKTRIERRLSSLKLDVWERDMQIENLRKSMTDRMNAGGSEAADDQGTRSDAGVVASADASTQAGASRGDGVVVRDVADAECQTDAVESGNDVQPLRVDVAPSSLPTADAAKDRHVGLDAVDHVSPSSTLAADTPAAARDKLAELGETPRTADADMREAATAVVPTMPGAQQPAQPAPADKSSVVEVALSSALVTQDLMHGILGMPTNDAIVQVRKDDFHHIHLGYMLAISAVFFISLPISFYIATDQPPTHAWKVGSQIFGLAIAALILRRPRRLEIEPAEA